MNLDDKILNPKVMSYVINKGIIIYPICEAGKWYIEVKNNKNRPKRFNKVIGYTNKLESHFLKIPIIKTYNFYYKKLIQLERQ